MQKSLHRTLSRPFVPEPTAGNGRWPSRLSRDGVDVEIRAFSPIERESPLAITLVQGISAGDRMDLTIQKAVELGASAIQPILAERSVVRLRGERGDSRREHWQRVATAACEQCGRNRVPAVAAALSLDNFHAPENVLKLLLATAGSSGLRSIRPYLPWFPVTKYRSLPCRPRERWRC